MKSALSFLFLLCLATTAAFAQPKADRDAIKAMCGCYDVKFNYAETFSPDTAYKVHEGHSSGGLELALLVEDKPGYISIQHLLIANDTTIIKHWRQDWTYQPNNYYAYHKDLTWQFKKASNTKGQWRQQVYQVDDSPRYEGLATWFHADGRSFWENVADAPLPRREFSTRSDYNVLKRRNRHELHSWGWMHEQDNEKINRTNKGEEHIASEKGLNSYTKTDMKRCKAAADWWKENQAYWARVRKVWNSYYAQNTDFTLEKTLDGKPVFMHLFALPNTASEADIRAIISRAYSTTAKASIK